MYSKISHGSEGYSGGFVWANPLMYSKISHGSEGLKLPLSSYSLLQYSIISDGSGGDEKWEKIQLCCSTAYFHMVVKVRMHLRLR